MKKDIHDLIAEALKKYNEKEPLAKQLQFDEKVKEAVEALKIFNKEEIKRIETKKHIFWRLLAITSVGLNFILLVASPIEIGHLVEEKVRENIIEPNVKNSLDKVIKENAADYVDIQLAPFKQKVDDLRTQIVNLKDTIAEAEEVSKQAQTVTGDLQQQSKLVGDQLNDINATLNIIALIVRADHDDRLAFDALLKIAKDSTSPFSSIASEVILTLVTDTGLQLEYNPQWDVLGITKPETLSLDDCKKIYSSQIRSDFKQALLNYIWKNNTFSKYDRLNFLMSVIQDDRSIKTVRYAMQQSDSETQIKHNMIDYGAYLEWWDKNKDRIKSESDKH